MLLGAAAACVILLSFPFPADQESHNLVKQAAMVRQVIGNKHESQHTVEVKYAPP